MPQYTGGCIVLKNLIKVANILDNLGLTKEADNLDIIIKKIASDEPTCPDHPDKFLSRKKVGWFCTECNDVVLLYSELPPTSGITTDKLQIADKPIDNIKENTLEKVTESIDVRYLPEKDRREFSIFLLGFIDYADQHVDRINTKNWFTGETITREVIFTELIRDRSFQELYKKYGQKIIDAYWAYIEKAADIIKSMYGTNGLYAQEELRALKRELFDFAQY